jgi:RNA 3'-terminal phosphate cyclase (ATP)
MPELPAGELVIDGSHGEGGGQILRTALALSAVTGRPLRVEKIRAGRPKPGLAAQHLTAIHSVAAVCAAEVAGATLGSHTLRFAPRSPPAAGTFHCDVAEAREGGSAGAATLVLQTVALPSVFAPGISRFHIRGGTHIAWSPTFDYLQEIWLPLLHRVGMKIEAALEAYGFYPAGGGEIVARSEGAGQGARALLRPTDLSERGALLAVSGRAIAANLPAHVPQRMADTARTLLERVAPKVSVDPLRVRAVCPGAALFLAAEYENIRVGFTSLGARGKSSEVVAEEAVGALLAQKESGAALDRHLADQMLLPLAFASGRSTFTCEVTTRHLRTNAWVIEQFGVARVEIEGQADLTARVSVLPLVLH